MTFSVIIPLYNKRDYICRAVQTAINQSVKPLEVIVVDDGSTDDGSKIVEQISSPLVRLISQQNMGVSASRNRGASESKGDFLAFLDADDFWEKDYLFNVQRLINTYPDCGLYSTGRVTRVRNKSYQSEDFIGEGIVENFFAASFRQHIVLPSCATIPRDLFSSIGGFPEGMKLGEDQYLWFKIACANKVCFSPFPLLNYSVSANNRSATIYKREVSEHSFKALFDKDFADRNEFLARCEIGRGIIFSVKGDVDYAREIEKFYAYTKLFRKAWLRLWVLNRLPKVLRGSVLSLYNWLARVFARKFV